jgi:hypothetical protein
VILLQPNSDSEDEAPKPKKKPSAAPPKKKKAVSDSDSDRYVVMHCQPVLWIRFRIILVTWIRVRIK